MKGFLNDRLLLIIEFLISIPIVYYAFTKVAIISKAGYMSIPLMYALLFLIILSIERALYIKKIQTNIGRVLKKINIFFEKKDFEEISALCKKYPSPVSSIIKYSVEYKDKSETKIKEVIEEIANFEMHKLNLNLIYISLIAKISPLMGLLGTVLGLLNSFNKMVKLSGNVSAAVFAEGISEALLTTVFGLIIAIPALIVFYILTSKIKNIVNQMEKTASLVLNTIKE